METPQVNFGQLIASVGTLEIQPVPPGNYDVKVIEASAGQSSTGKLMYKVRYEIQGGPQHGRKVYNNITLTNDGGNALRMFFVNMKSHGLDEAYFAMNPSPETVAGALVGRQVSITIEHEPYRGVMREQVRSVRPPAGIAAGLGAPAAGPGVGQPIAPGVAFVPPVVAAAPPIAPPIQQGLPPVPGAPAAGGFEAAPQPVQQFEAAPPAPQQFEAAPQPAQQFAPVAQVVQQPAAAPVQPDAWAQAPVAQPDAGAQAAGAIVPPPAAPF